MERITSYVESRHFRIGDLYAFGISVGIEFAADRKTFFVVVLAISAITTYRLTRGMARQFWGISELMRCSIWYHLKVRDGQYQTGMIRPVSTASCWSAVCQSRRREQFDRPLSAVIMRRFI